MRWLERYLAESTPSLEHFAEVAAVMRLAGEMDSNGPCPARRSSRGSQCWGVSSRPVRGPT